jgi:hypothetical protein
MTPPLSAKQASLRLIERMDEHATFEDILYELYFLQKVERGLQATRQGHTHSHEEIRKEFAQWLS